MSEGDCIHCGESGNWCTCDSPWPAVYPPAFSSYDPVEDDEE